MNKEGQIKKLNEEILFESRKMYGIVWKYSMGS